MNIVKKNNKRIRQRQRVQFKLKKVNRYNNKLRISVFLSEKHATAQLISADGKSTLAYVSSQQSWFKEESKDQSIKTHNVAGSKAVGARLGKILRESFTNASFYFDRGRRVYGTIASSKDQSSLEKKPPVTRIKALADAIREQGIIL